jgi:hypothetical protein
MPGEQDAFENMPGERSVMHLLHASGVIVRQAYEKTPLIEDVAAKS